MRRYIALIASVSLVCACDFSALLPDFPDESYIPADEVVISPDRLELKVGETYQMSFTVTPESAANQAAEWSIIEGGDVPEGVATVDESGLVTALKEGFCGIKVKIGGKSDLCYLNVEEAEPAVYPQSISITPSEITLYPGETAQLTATVLPEGAVEYELHWFSEWWEVATIDGNGLVTAVSPGEAWVGAGIEYMQLNGHCRVTVLPREVESVDLQVDDNVTLEVGESLQVSATVLPENATDKTLSWESSDAAVVTVSAEGLVEAVGPGLATVSATSTNGKSDSFSVSVPEPVVAVENIIFESTDVLLPLGGAPLTELVFEPADAVYAHAQEVVWSSSDESVVAIDDEGRAVAVDYGTSTVTASVGGHSASATVTVSQNADAAGVKMGFGSVRWAGYNVGAKVPADYGNLYAWADIDPWNKNKQVSFMAYKWADTSDMWGNTFTKYNSTDHLNTIVLADDAAHQEWGMKWRMPTADECLELIDACEWVVSTRKNSDGSDIKGYTAIAPCGARIFFPCVEGWAEGAYTGVFFRNEFGLYWSSTGTNGGNGARAVEFKNVTAATTKPYVQMAYCYRFSVHAVRAVWDDKL